MRLAFARLLVVMLSLFGGVYQVAAREQWTPQQAREWYKSKPWLVGCNFIPSTAINQLEMWQAETFDLPTIDRELGWAQGLGFTSIRVFLHHLLWEQDKDGFTKRIDQFLDSADRHKIGVLFVLLDSVWDPDPKLGKQREPKPGLHNSGWVQSPGRAIFKDPARYGELEGYVKGVIARFKDDRRIHGWDLVNEPDNENRGSYLKLEPPNKQRLAILLLEKVYPWARSAEPSQPLTTGIWRGDWSSPEKMTKLDRFMVEQSDVVSFHDYGNLEGLKKRVEALRRYERPLLCTEYMARPAGSTFEPHLAYLKEVRVGAYNWGFVNGKSQTIYPWDSWKQPYGAEPKVWFHDIFRADGTPYIEGEVRYIRQVTGATAPRPVNPRGSESPK